MTNVMQVKPAAGEPEANGALKPFFLILDSFSLTIAFITEALPQCKLFVGRLPVRFTETDIRPIFEPFGELNEVRSVGNLSRAHLSDGDSRQVFVIKNNSTGESKGCCFVKYTLAEAGEKAIAALHGKMVCEGSTGALVVKFADNPRQRLRRRSNNLLNHAGAYMQVRVCTCT